MKRINLTGSRFGKLVVVDVSKLGSRRSWDCVCDCGKSSAVSTSNLKSGNSKSCGCSAFEKGRGGSHFMTNSSEYKSWSGMIQRCKNPKNHKFKNYGGRGICVCDNWMNFEDFIFDMGKKPSAIHSIDRINNDGNYCPENCRWATPKQQSQNQRKRTIKTYFEVFDFKGNIGQACAHFGVNYGVLMRLKNKVNVGSGEAIKLIIKSRKMGFKRIRLTKQNLIHSRFL